MKKFFNKNVGRTVNLLSAQEAIQIIKMYIDNCTGKQLMSEVRLKMVTYLYDFMLFSNIKDIEEVVKFLMDGKELKDIDDDSKKCYDVLYEFFNSYSNYLYSEEVDIEQASEYIIRMDGEKTRISDKVKDNGELDTIEKLLNGLFDIGFDFAPFAEHVCELYTNKMKSDIDNGNELDVPLERELAYCNLHDFYENEGSNINQRPKVSTKNKQEKAPEPSEEENTVEEVQKEKNEEENTESVQEVNENTTEEQSSEEPASENAEVEEEKAPEVNVVDEQKNEEVPTIEIEAPKEEEVPTIEVNVPSEEAKEEKKEEVQEAPTITVEIPQEENKEEPKAEEPKEKEEEKATDTKGEEVLMDAESEDKKKSDTKEEAKEEPKAQAVPHKKLSISADDILRATQDIDPDAAFNYFGNSVDNKRYGSSNDDDSSFDGTGGFRD